MPICSTTSRMPCCCVVLWLVMVAHLQCLHGLFCSVHSSCFLPCHSTTSNSHKSQSCCSLLRTWLTRNLSLVDRKRGVRTYRFHHAPLTSRHNHKRLHSHCADMSPVLERRLEQVRRRTNYIHQLSESSASVPFSFRETAEATIFCLQLHSLARRLQTVPTKLDV